MKHKTKTTLLILLILISALLWAVKPVKAMCRESDRSIPVQGVVILSLDQALNLSLAYGDYRRVDVNWAEVAV